MIGGPTSTPNAEGRDVELLVPANDVADPELSIVIPALNEELTIAQFVDWCMEGLQRANVRGEVLIIDSSTDATAEIAVAKGARVLKVPKRGLGRAYIDAIPFIRGEYVLMGDADCTYDFRDLGPFMQSFHERSRICHGVALPRLHRARFHAAAAPVLRHTHHDLVAEFSLRQRLLRHSLRHAWHYPRCPVSHGLALAIVGIRLGDGVEVGPHGIAHG